MILKTDCSDGEVSVVGGNKPNEGRVEICRDRTWSTVCDNSFDMKFCRDVLQTVGRIL